MEKAKEKFQEINKDSIATLEKIVKSKLFNSFIIAVIILNAIVLGILATPSLIETMGSFFGSTGELAMYGFLIRLDYFCLYFFICELVLKLIVYDYRFFKDGWNIFDFVIVAMSLVPEIEALVILRTFRVFRVLRLISNIKSLRRISAVLISSIPAILSTSVILGIIFYIYAVMGVILFGDTTPQFASLGKALLALFQVMTLDNWSNDIAQPVLAFHPNAWLFFISFILLSIFTVLNLAVGIVVESINHSKLASHIEQDLNIDEAARKEFNEKLQVIEAALMKREIEKIEQRESEKTL